MATSVTSNAVRKGFTRRQVICMSATGAAAAMLVGMPKVGCAEEGGVAESRNLSFQAGTYTGTGIGRGGQLTVEVEFSDSAIESVTVTENDETPYISDAALERVPADIVAYQSTGIDGVTSATLTSYAIISAVEDAAEQAGADMDALRETPQVEKSAETVTIDAEVVIAGAGAAGMACAVACAQAGANKVVVLEKGSNIGGNALVSGGWLEYIYAPDEMRLEMTDGYEGYFEQILQTALDNGADPDFVQAVRDDLDAYYAAGKTTVYDSTGLYSLELCIVEGGNDFSGISAENPVNDPEANGPQLNDWLTEMGVEWKSPLSGIVGYPWPHWTGVKDARNGQGYFDLFNKAMDEQDLPIQIVTLTPASEVIMEDGRAAGLRGVSDDGTVYEVRASKAVVLATGGYSGSPDMLKEYNETWDWTDDTVIPTTNAYGHTGDGIKMGVAAGGFTAEMGYPMIFPLADAKNWSTETIVGDSGNCLLVNTEGQRFVDETASRYVISAALMEQPEQRLYIISDSLNNKCHDGLTEFGADMQKLLDNGQLFMADTLEELAAQIGMDENALVATVERYNEVATSGEDPDFGRSAFTDESVIGTAPFYASPRTWAAHITIGGLVTDNGAVITESGEAVEGLYAAGEVVVGDCGVCVLGSGLALARALYA